MSNGCSMCGSQSVNVEFVSGMNPVNKNIRTIMREEKCAVCGHILLLEVDASILILQEVISYGYKAIRKIKK